MNAHTPLDAHRAAAPLTPLAVQNMDVLLALETGDHESNAALARHLDRDKSNLAKTLKSLGEAGLVHDVAGRNVPDLTPGGLAAVEAWGRANGAPSGDGEQLVPLDLIDPWPDQPRQHKDADVIEDMAASIGDQGVLQAITLRPSPVTPGRYQVIIGETRRAASCVAVQRGWQPADFAIPAKVRDLTDAEAFKLAVVENVQREDLHWADEARALYKMQQAYKFSASELAGIFGNRKKRSIQDYTKIARELDPKILAKAYLPRTLPDGKPNPDCLTYVKAREMVGDKAPPPVLDLSPGLALALMEVVEASRPTELRQGSTLTVVLSAEPKGPLLKLSQHAERLVTFGFEQGRDMVARAPVTDKLIGWLGQVGYLADPVAALFKARASVLGGDLQANAHPPERYVTAELNQPEKPQDDFDASDPVLAEFSQHRAETDPDDALRERARQIGDAVLAQDEPEEEEIPHYLRRLAGGGEPPPASPPVATATPAPPAAPAVETLPPMLAIVMVELAHRIAHDGVERGPQTWAAPVLANWHEDKARLQQLGPQGHRFLAMMPQGDRTLATLTRRGLDWLLASVRMVEVMGRPQLGPTVLGDQQIALMGRFPGAGLTYHTPWLNPPEAVRQETETPPGPVAGSDGQDAGDAAANLPCGEGEADREAASAPPASEPRAYQLADVQRALLACYGQLGQLDNLISRLRSKAGATHQAEIDQHRRLIEAVRETAKANLPEDVFNG